MKKNYMFVGHILPERNSVYEKNLLRCFLAKTPNVDIVSINKAIRKYDKIAQESWNIQVIPTVRKPIIDEIFRFFKFAKIISQWCKVHKDSDKSIILLSPSIEIINAVKFMQKFYRFNSVGLIIDTALGNIKPDTILNKYLLKCYKKTEETFKYMSASMALNENVFDYLNLTGKPCLHTKIGHSLTEYNFNYIKNNAEIKTIVYTGSLIDYDGTQQLLEAMTLLDTQKYQLHIYGTGPKQDLVSEYEKKYSNIHYMGYLPNEEMKSVMANADLLINPRLTNKYTDIFGFPSKIIEYLLSGTPVLTTRFAAMPEDYTDFVHIIDDSSAHGIANSIVEVLNLDDMILKNKCEKAYKYIYDNYKYTDIVDEMIKFMDNLKK